MSTQFFSFVVATALFKRLETIIIPVIVLSFCAFSLLAQENATVVDENSNSVSPGQAIKAPVLEVPTSNLTQTFWGRVPGISSSRPVDQTTTDGTQIFLTSTHETSTVQPLILIDGMESSSDDLTRLQVEDIKSFSIFKEASALAIFGERGAAGGVISIVTKSGGKYSVKSETNTVTTETEYPSESDLVTTQPENEDAPAIETDVDLAETEDPFPGLKIYPNPFAGTLQLTGAENCILRVLSEDGVIVHTKKIVNPIETIPLEHLRAGVYFFSVNNGKQTKMVKGVKNK